MPRRLMWFISVGIVFAWAPVASAQIWTAAGATGIVDESGQKIVRFSSTGSVSIKRSGHGTLIVRFPVQTVPNLLVPQEGDCPEMRVNLRDTGPGARVIVRLMQLGIFPGSPNQLTSLGEIDSDTRQDGDPNQYRSYAACLSVAPDTVFGPGTGEFLFDFAFNTYFVEVQLIKTTPFANPGLMSLQICPAQDACDP